ncbi:unnamed protein product [Wickerhamomyces anomalus]
MSKIPNFLEEITLDDVSTHIYDLYVDSAPSENQDLGIVSKKDQLQISISDSDYQFEQSISNLNTSNSSTGFVLWRVSIPFVKWIQTKQLHDFKDKYVVELGAGVTGLLSSTIGLKTQHWIATDQYHLIKLLKKNISNNVPIFQSSTIECDVKPKKKQIVPKIDVCVYDWENIEQGLYEIKELNPKEPDFIIGCDIVYNDYLVPYLVDAIDKLAGPSTRVLIGLQLRLPENIEYFVEQLLKRGLKVYKYEESSLIEDLQRGYVVYYITKSA